MTPTLPLADVVADALTGVASTLQLPVHVAAIALLLALVLELGRAATETLRRLRPGRSPLATVAAAALTDPRRGPELAREAPSSLAQRAVEEIAQAHGTGRGEAIEHALADYELGVQRRLDRTRLLVRAGPAVGLMGTLIPLGPGIAALGRGDVAALSGDLRTAFAATVVGILVGTAAFALTLLRTRVCTEDLAALERAVGAVDRRAVPPGAGPGGTGEVPAPPPSGAPPTSAPAPAPTPVTAPHVAPRPTPGGAA